MPTTVFGASSAVLSNGEFLVIGGDTGTVSSPTATNAVSLYNPATGAWSAAPHPRHPAGVLHRDDARQRGRPRGRRHRGAWGPRLDVPAELYDPTANTWTAAGTLTVARTHASARLLANGQVLVAGGLNTAGTPLSLRRAVQPDRGLVGDDRVLVHREK